METETGDGTNGSFLASAPEMAAPCSHVKSGTLPSQLGTVATGEWRNQPARPGQDQSGLLKLADPGQLTWL